MLLEHQKVKDSKVLLNVMDNQEDLWDMVLCIIEDQVQWDQHQLQVEFIKERTYQDIWVMKTVTVQNLEIVKVDMDKKRNINKR